MRVKITALIGTAVSRHIYFAAKRDIIGVQYSSVVWLVKSNESLLF